MKERDVQFNIEKARKTWRGTEFVVLGFSMFGCWFFGMMSIWAVLIITLGYAIVNGALKVNLKRIKSKLPIRGTVDGTKYDGKKT